MSEHTITLPTPAEDSPEFWIGRIKQVVQMERSRVINEKKGMKLICDLMQQREEHEYRKHLRAVNIAEALGRNSQTVLSHNAKAS